MPVLRSEWFVPSGDCAGFLPTLLVDPPRSHRAEWTYSNGNYCALGLLVKAVTGLPLDQAAQSILLDPIGVSGVHLTTGGHLPTDVGYAPGLGRLADSAERAGSSPQPTTSLRCSRRSRRPIEA